MAEDAKIGYPPTRWLAPGDNTAVFAFMAGLKKSKEMMFGRIFSGREAAEIGMINYRRRPRHSGAAGSIPGTWRAWSPKASSPSSTARRT